MSEAIQTAADVVCALVGAVHVYILVLEMFLWRGRARKVFGTSATIAHASASLAANIAIYNGFLAGGMFFALSTGYSTAALMISAFVMIAGVFGAASIKIAILFTQFLPALAAFALTLYGSRFSQTRYNMHYSIKQYRKPDKLRLLAFLSPV